MTEQQNGKNRYIQCSMCPALFFSKADLERHMAAYGSDRVMHRANYDKTHGKLERGYGSDE